MKRKPTLKNSEKIWKLEYLEPNFLLEPDDQNKVNEDNEIQDTTDLSSNYQS